ncbi:MAG: M23 family metallopeptidase [Dermatophilaceae bacterium]
MSSPAYRGRHYAGRHRVHLRSARLPRALSATFVLPTTAAAALVATATGATVAESTPLTLDLSGSQTAMARTQQAASDESTTELALRRQDVATTSAAIQGRTEATARAARAAKRKADAEAAARAKAEREGKKWVRPIKVWNITSDFGPRWGKTHDGMDLGAPTGTPLYAMSKGVVTGSFYDSSFGNKVEITYWNGDTSWYAHLSKRSVTEGDTVMPGDLVGLVGNTGHSFGAHLHLEIQPDPDVDRAIDPYPWLQDRGLT